MSAVLSILPAGAAAQPDSVIPIRTSARLAEVGWFAALCNEDYEFLGIPDGHLRSSFAHCADIFRTADRLGYQSILMPSGFQVGQEPLVFGGAMAALAPRIQQLLAVRMGEIHPPMLARHLSTLDHMLQGRLTVNIISSDLAGERIAPADRYQRSDEVVQILKQAWTRDEIDFQGRFYNLKLANTDAVKPYQQNGGPLLYFGGTSSPARELCAKHCDVFLMWPETEDMLRETMQDVSARAAAYGRVLDFGLRIHVIVRETEAEAIAFAQRLVSRLDEKTGEEIRSRSQDNNSEGMRRQDALRKQSKDDFIEEHIWSGIGRARAGCGGAIVGNPEQVLKKLNRYLDLGIRAFILSGYPHKQECELFARYILPKLQTCRLPILQGRAPAQTPVTPLTTAERR
jgi:alkanesulfonate monooxygenase